MPSETKPKPNVKFVIPEEQWSLPVAYSSDGEKLVSLRQAVEQNTPHLSLPKLSDEQRRNLVAARIAAQPKFKIAMLGAGLVDKKRAIEEVRAGSKVGRNLMEIEQRVIQSLLENVDPRMITSSSSGF